MKFSEQWLREMVNPPVSTAELAERLTMSGLEVESLTAVAPAFSGVCVALVVEVRMHPEADRLRICTADVGHGERLQVVTGAANVRDGMRAPLARVGAALPGEKRVSRTRLRGVESEGVLCSLAELGLADAAEEVLELPPDAPPGADVREYLKLNDCSIELNVTPNRGDCLSVLGIAREVGAEYGLEARGPTIAPVPAAIGESFPVVVSEAAACPRYVGRIVRRIDPAAATPLWMIERLRRSGLHPIHPVVDITNFVMLELGQPMHAFDLSHLKGGIEVRCARQGERISLLDGQVLELADDTLVIADHGRAVALAGIMGGVDSAVCAATRDIFLESAYFSPGAIAGRGRQYKLQTDSSQRFERGVDFELQSVAVERATRLVLEVCGGEAGPVTEVVQNEQLPSRAPVRLRDSRLRRVLGFAPDQATVTGILERLGMQVQAAGEEWHVTPPPSRLDISIEADLIEEVARINGYELVPACMPSGVVSLGSVMEGGAPRIVRAREALVQRGYQEAITYSFVAARKDAAVGVGAHASIALANPISADMAVMRTSLWTGLLQALNYNISRQQTRVRLFESGRSFENLDGKLRQINRLSGISCGASWPEQWGARSLGMDFFDLKGDVATVLEVLAPHVNWKERVASHAALHPGQAVEFSIDGRRVAVLGALHPDLYNEFDIKTPIFLFDIELDALPPANVPRYEPVPRYPLVRRDLSFTVAHEVSAAEILRTARSRTQSCLRDLQLFDVYEGEGIDSGKKSVALGLIFQGVSSTLIDKDIDAQVAVIVEELETRLGAVLRDS